MYGNILTLTSKSSNASSKSRDDYWLISDNLLQFVKDCYISPAPLTDHCAIFFVVKGLVHPKPRPNG